MRQCRICGEEKELILFKKNKSGKDGRSNICKSCENTRGKEYYKTHSSKKIYNARVNYMRRTYSLTPEQYEELYIKQDGKCANSACNDEVAVIDHDHTTGVVRGLLCRKCNLALGHVDDDINKLTGLLAYLTDYMKYS